MEARDVVREEFVPSEPEGAPHATHEARATASSLSSIFAVKVATKSIAQRFKKDKSRYNRAGNGSSFLQDGKKQ